jgi:phosphoglycerate dehydrogenase-like enzyme
MNAKAMRDERESDRRRPRVVVLDDYQGAALRLGGWERLLDRCEVVALREHLATTEELIEALAGAEIVVAMRERTGFDAERLDRLTDLRLLVTTAMGNAAIDLDAAARNGVVVCGTRHLDPPTVEHAWALILGLARSLPEEDARLRAGGWQGTVGFDLDGATLSLLGLGRLGSAMVPIARAFGMRPIAWSENLDQDRAAELGVEAVSREQLFERADVLSIHLRLGARTRGLVGAAELGSMKPGALLVNTSRAPIVDADALFAALREGRLGGAALDVFDLEPLPPGDRWRTAPRTVLSPHLGYVTESNYAVYFSDAVEDILAYLDGTPIRRLGGGAA